MCIILSLIEKKDSFPKYYIMDSSGSHLIRNQMILKLQEDASLITDVGLVCEPVARLMVLRNPLI